MFISLALRACALLCALSKRHRSLSLHASKRFVQYTSLVFDLFSSVNPFCNQSHANRSVRLKDNRPLYLQGSASMASKTTVPNASSKTQTKELLCKSIEKYNDRLTIGLYYERDRGRFLFLAADKCTDAQFSL